MEFPVLADFPRATVLPLHGVQDPGGPFAVLTEDRADGPRLLELAERCGPRLLVPEVWSRILPRCGVLVSSAISGGTIGERFQEAAAAYPRRCWLLMEPMAMEFPLPCPTGTGNQITITNYDKHFFSEGLCCEYTHFIRNQQGFLVLWDTAQTLYRKMELAKAAGFLGVVSPLDIPGLL